MRNKQGGDDKKKQSGREQHQKASTRERSWRLDGERQKNKGKDWADTDGCFEGGSRR